MEFIWMGYRFVSKMFYKRVRAESLRTKLPERVLAGGWERKKPKPEIVIKSSRKQNDLFMIFIGVISVP